MTRPHCQQPDACKAKSEKHCVACALLLAHHGPNNAKIRIRQMSALYRAGKTMKEIGEVYGITRERVRQLLKKHAGMTGRDGGMAKTARENRARLHANKEAACFVKRGCTLAQYRDLRRSGASEAFSTQRSNAKKRGVGWNLTLWQWWSIWEASGRWEQRGRKYGQYVMCRVGDQGAYEVGNVYIDLAINNVTRGKHNKHKHLPVGVTPTKSGKYTAATMIDGKVRHLGTYPTPELAQAAYLEARHA